MLRRIPRAVSKGGNLSKGATVDTGAVAKTDVGKKKGDERRLYCDLLAAGATMSLYDMDQPGAVQGVVERMTTMWEGATRPA
jgi:hypothetical protein